MKVSQHSGRIGSMVHNERLHDNNALDSSQNHYYRAPLTQEIIDLYNEYLIKKGENPIENISKLNGQQIEYAYYLYFAKQQNLACEDQRQNKNRYKTADDLLKSNKTKPEEVIIQLGNKDEKLTKEEAVKAYKTLLKEIAEWNEAHEKPFLILSASIHLDEETPHMHIRRVYTYQSNKGRTLLGQNKALIRAGMELPNPEEPEGRYNNRKMTFDKEMRDLAVETWRALGHDVDDIEHGANKKHLSVEEFKIQKAKEKDEIIAEKDETIKELEREINSNALEAATMEKRVDNLKEAHEEAKKAIQPLTELKNLFKQIKERLKKVKRFGLKEETYEITKADLDKLENAAEQSILLTDKVKELESDLNKLQEKYDKKQKDYTEEYDMHQNCLETIEAFEKYTGKNSQEVEEIITKRNNRHETRDDFYR